MLVKAHRLLPLMVQQNYITYGGRIVEMKSEVWKHCIICPIHREVDRSISSRG